jgi:hypothetical protein
MLMIVLLLVDGRLGIILSPRRPFFVRSLRGCGVEINGGGAARLG